MRKDAKIGILVGVMIAVGVIVYILYSGDKATTGEPGVSAKTERPAGEAKKAPDIFAKTSDDGVIPFAGFERKERQLPPPAEQADERRHEQPKELTSSTDQGPFVSVNFKPPIVLDGDRTSPPPVEKAPPPVEPKQGFHVVQEGDSLWAIAVKKYNDGSKYELIASANPGLDKDNLRVGQKLLIPAIGVKDKPQPAGAVEPAPLSPGERVYVVQKDDAGFWAIAEKEYNDGSKFYLIQKANPNVDTKRLRAGMKLIIPALSADKASAGAAARKDPSGRPKGTEVPSDGRPRFYDAVKQS